MIRESLLDVQEQAYIYIYIYIYIETMVHDSNTPRSA